MLPFVFLTQERESARSYILSLAVVDVTEKGGKYKKQQKGNQDSVDPFGTKL